MPMVFHGTDPAVEKVSGRYFGPGGKEVPAPMAQRDDLVAPLFEISRTQTTPLLLPAP